MATATCAARRRARRKALGAAYRLKSEAHPTNAVVTTETDAEKKKIDTSEITASEESNTGAVTVTTCKMTACQRCRARRRAATTVRGLKSEARPSYTVITAAAASECSASAQGKGNVTRTETRLL